MIKVNLNHIGYRRLIFLLSNKYWRYSENYGGKREGAGRPSIGETKNIKLTLPAELWEWLEECVEHKHAASRSELIRNIIQEAKG